MKEETEARDEIFPTNEVNKFNIYANYYPLSSPLQYEQHPQHQTKLPTQQHQHQNENHHQIPQNHPYTDNYMTNLSTQYYSTYEHEYERNHRNTNSKWYDNYSEHHTHHHMHTHTLDLSNAHILKSNLLTLLGDGRIILLSRIPILYRTKFGREFRDDISIDGKVKLIDVFLALGSPFILLGDGGNTSVRIEYSPDQTPPYTTNDYSQYSTYNNSEMWPQTLPQPNITPFSTTEAHARLKNNLDILLEDGKVLYLADIPVLYKSRFGIDYREGLEFKGRMKLQRLFHHYGYPYVLEGEGLQTTVRKVPTATFASSSPWHNYSQTNSALLQNRPPEFKFEQESPDLEDLKLNNHFESLVSPVTCLYSRSSPAILAGGSNADDDSNSPMLSRLSALTSIISKPKVQNEVNNKTSLPNGNFDDLDPPPNTLPLLQLSTSSISMYPMSNLPLQRNLSEYPASQPLLTPNLSNISYTTTSTVSVQSLQTSNSIIIDQTKWDKNLDVGYLGLLLDSVDLSNHSSMYTFFNSTNPFLVVCIGQPGSGLSHTLNILLENCLVTSSVRVPVRLSPSHIDLTQDSTDILHQDEELDLGSITQQNTEINMMPPLITSQSKLCTLIFHSFHHQSEVPGLSLFHSVPHPIIDRGISKVIVLVSPTYYQQRKQYYEKLNPHYVILPLIFRWSTLNTKQIKKFMNLSDLSSTNPSQQYPSCLIDILKNYQSSNYQLSYPDYIRMIFEQIDEHWHEWIHHRINFIKYFIDEYYHTSTGNHINDRLHVECYQPLNLDEIFQPSHLVLCDLFDPILSYDQYTIIYHNFMNIFREYQFHDDQCGKLLIFNNLYQNISSSTSTPTTTTTSSSIPSHTSILKYEFLLDIIDMIRYIHLEKMRIIFTGQSPLDIPSELLEFSTLTILHQFQSLEGFNYLQNKLPLQSLTIHHIRNLQDKFAYFITSQGSTSMDDTRTSLSSQHDHVSHPPPPPPPPIQETRNILNPQYVYPILLRDRICSPLNM